MKFIVDDDLIPKKPTPPAPPKEVKVDTSAIVPAFKQELKKLLDEHYNKLELLTECDEEDIKNGNERDWEFTVERDPITALISKIHARPL
jgi:hypothetical protein